MDEEEDNVDMDQEGSDDEDADDKLEKVGPRPGSKSYACRFCSESFTSELRLILHFREEHLDPGDEEEWPSESESDEGEETTPALDFMTDYERSVLKEPVFPSPNPDSEEKDCIASEKNDDIDDNIEEVDLDPEKGEDDEEISMESESGGADDEIEIDEERRRINEEDNAVKETDDNNDELEDVGSASGARSRPHHPCQFCSESFTSELRLILHFREEHLDSEEESLSEDESDPEDDESKEEDSDVNVNASMLDFVTDYEWALLKEPVFNRDSGSGEEDVGPDPESDGEEDDEEVATDPAEEEDFEEVARSTAESPKVVLRQVPPKSSKLETDKGDPGTAFSPRKPPGTAKAVTKKSIDKPKKIRLKKAMHDCVFCDKSYSAPFLLHRHIRSHIKERPYFCKFCDKSFGVRYNLKVHMIRVHPRLIPFKCKFCAESFTNRTRFKNHMTSHSADRKFECEYCEMRYHTKKDLRRHVIISHIRKQAYECDQCEKAFTRADNLHAHLKNVHNIVRTIVSLPDMTKKFVCEHCKTRFTRKDDMTKHLRIFHPFPNQKIQSVATSKESINSTT